MTVRSFTDADLDSVVAVETAAAEFPWSTKQFQSSLTAGNHCRVLDVDGQVIGFSIFSLVLDEASLLNIAITPARQGSGFGRLLLERGLNEVAGLGARVCFLEVRKSNLSAQSLYRSLGFEVVGERRGYYPAHAGREDALVMSRQLPAVSDTFI